MAKDKKTDKIVAIKSVNKEQILRLDKKRHVYREKTLLSNMSHPYIIKLITTMIVRFKDFIRLTYVRMINFCISHLRIAQTGLFSTWLRKSVK